MLSAADDVAHSARPGAGVLSYELQSRETRFPTLGGGQAHLLLLLLFLAPQELLLLIVQQLLLPLMLQLLPLPLLMLPLQKLLVLCLAPLPLNLLRPLPRRSSNPPRTPSLWQTNSHGDTVLAGIAVVGEEIPTTHLPSPPHAPERNSIHAGCWRCTDLDVMYSRDSDGATETASGMVRQGCHPKCLK
jgi:hypothetical protein